MRALRCILGVLMFFVVSISVHAQQSQDVKNVVMYDPLFWKDQLRLKDAQCKSITRINQEYYENLKQVIHETPTDRAAIQVRAAEYLQQRNQKIWDTFHPNQKKRWRKLWDHQYAGVKKLRDDELTSLLSRSASFYQM
ncbi:MAG TPA: hypothetical protein VIN08_05260 [Ohtaekwangia sp.]|uniref:hypothetical protein n=1 Tax=Ohtaekwangia sp. TaxID=2066019 RepID=UPI002F925DA8